MSEPACACGEETLKELIQDFSYCLRAHNLDTEDVSDIVSVIRALAVLFQNKRSMSVNFDDAAQEIKEFTPASDDLNAEAFKVGFQNGFKEILAGKMMGRSPIDSFKAAFQNLGLLPTEPKKTESATGSPEWVSEVLNEPIPEK